MSAPIVFDEVSEREFSRQCTQAARRQPDKYGQLRGLGTSPTRPGRGERATVRSLVGYPPSPGRHDVFDYRWTSALGGHPTMRTVGWIVVGPRGGFTFYVSEHEVPTTWHDVFEVPTT